MTVARYQQMAEDECKRGGNLEKARVYAELATSEAIMHLVGAVASLKPSRSDLTSDVTAQLHNINMARGQR